DPRHRRRPHRRPRPPRRPRRHERDLPRDRREPAPRGRGGGMSEQHPPVPERTEESAATNARPATVPDRTIQAGRRGAPHGPMGAAGMPAEKAMAFWPSAKRLLGRLRPHRLLIGLTVVLAAVSTALMVTG